MNKVYEIITEQFLKKLEEGVVPWQKGWDAPSSHPQNLVGKNNYHGINLLILSMSGYPSKYWLTFNQAKKIGAKVKKGEKSTPVIFYKSYENEEGESIPVLRYYRVFNLKQVEGVPSKYLPSPEEHAALDEITGSVDERARPLLLAYRNRPPIFTGGDKAFYNPGNDYIQMPKRRYFKSLEEYWSTLFHELTHSTGGRERLNRKGVAERMTMREEYSFEELVAEMGAAFMCAEAGIDNTQENAVNYIASWLKILKNEPQWVVKAAQKANKAVKYMIGEREEERIQEAA